MSIKYCGIYTDSSELKCIGESDDVKFKKFINKHEKTIIKEPLSKKIELNMGFYITFLKFDGKVICVVSNAKYNQVKSFIESTVNSINILEKKINMNSKIKYDKFKEISDIITSKIELGLSNENMETESNSNYLNINSSTGSKLIRNEQEEKEMKEAKKMYKITKKEELNSEPTVPPVFPLKRNQEIKEINKETESESKSYKKKEEIKECKLLKDKEEARNSVKSEQFSEIVYIESKLSVQNKVNRLKPTAENKNKLIDKINEDIKDLNQSTKRNILEIINNKEDLNELLVNSKKINNEALHYKENAVEIKTVTRNQLYFWAFAVGSITFAFVWVICSFTLCGNLINPFCKI